MVVTLSLPRRGERVHLLAQTAGRTRPLGFLLLLDAGILVGRPELRETFVELIRQLDELAYGCDRCARALRRLARDAGDDLHGVGDTFRAAHLLLGSEGDFLNEFR